MASTGWRLRALALLCGGAVAVHELRYLIGHHGEAAESISSGGHAYLAVLAPTVGVVLFLLLVDFALRLVQAVRGGLRASAPIPPFRPLSAAASGCLVASYGLQEFLEAVLATGQPPSVAVVVGHGGWLAVPLAIAIGTLIALLLRGAEVVIARVARGARANQSRVRPSSVGPPSFTHWPPLDVVARFLAARGPPPASA